MSGIFRPAFRMPRAVQAPFGALSGVASEGGVIIAAHLPASSGTLEASLRLSVSTAVVGEASTFGAPTMRLALRPVVFDASGSIFGPAIEGSHVMSPVALANGQSYFAPALVLTLEASAVGSGQSLFAAGVAAAVTPPSMTNAPSFAALKLTFRLSPAAYANAASFDLPAIGQPGIKGAPLVASGGNIFAPRVDLAHMFEVVGTLNVAGWTPRAARRSRPVASWPNLPNVEAPPWRLMVVTPEVARARARSLMAQRRRAEQSRRTREAKRKLNQYLDETIEAEIAHTVVRLVGEEA